jgi:hyaluronoglucosaminidase
MFRRGVDAWLALAAALAVGSLAAGTAVADQSATDSESLPAIYPVPQSIQRHGEPVRLGSAVAVVTGPHTDAAAVGVVLDVLRSAGVGRIDQTDDTGRIQPGEPVIDVGGVEENPDSGRTLAGLGVTDATGLPAEGYVVADGRVGDHPVVVLAGHDPVGTFYAAQTLRQSVQGSRGVVPGVEVRDWPAYAVRGVIEGFYGPPWSDQARADQLDFDGRHKLNTYVYSPKDDPYLRAEWRVPYPAARLAQLAALVDRARADHVHFTYALSPGLSVCYSSTADEQALAAKFQSLWDIGVRDFAIPLDDISYTSWNCAEDQTAFGTGGAAAGAAQAYLVNEVQRDFIATHPGASRLEMVPTEYYGVAASPYKDVLRTQLDPAVVVEWTGVDVVTPTITAGQAAAARSVFGHDILVWDNYPVNDYAPDRLLLGPYVGRQAGMSGSLVGLTANPMIEPMASDVALSGVADFTWNDRAYDPQRSWQAALDELAGPDPLARRALGAFADLEHYSQIDPVQAPVLAGKFASFWPAWENGDDRAAGALDDYLRLIEDIPALLESHMHNPGFVAEIRPWLDAAATWGQADRAALRMLVDERANRGSAAAADRAQARALATKGHAYLHPRLSGTVTVGDGVVDTFVDAALAENDRWLGLTGLRPVAQTSLSAYQNHTPGKMVDGDVDTYFWSDRPPSDGDVIGVDLGADQPIAGVSVQMSKPDSPDDYLHRSMLEYSSDGRTWTAIGTFADTPTVIATLPTGTVARYIRLRANGSQGNWVVVREFTVTGPNIGPITVTGGPTPAGGSSLAAAADGDPDTAYTASTSPAPGDALVVGLPATRPVGSVEVVGHGSGTVQLHRTDGWHTIGKLADGYTALTDGGMSADAIRLLWAPNSAPPAIDEVVPVYADRPAVTLSPVPAQIDVEVGQSTSFAVGLTANGLSDEHGVLLARPAAGALVRPPAAPVAVDRGAQPTRTLTVKGIAVGTYRIPLSFLPDSGATPTTVTVRVHPKTSTKNVALSSAGAVATASSVEDDLAQFTPDHAIDGSLATRWSSDYTDGEWLQVRLAAPQHVGKVVLYWETAHANGYQIQTSADGLAWTTTASIADSQGGTETVWLDQADVRYLRMLGVSRSTQFGYSLRELQVYPVD